MLLGLLGLLVGLLLIQDPRGNLSLLVVIGGLWLTYLSVLELVGLIRRRAAAAVSGGRVVSGRRRRLRQLVALSGVTVIVVGLLALGLVITTKRAAQRAEAQAIEKCNGEASLCDLSLNMVMFPGTHNSMSSALYPGWLFAEQVNTIKDQLNSGVRALLVDTYYGVPSSSRLPGSETPIVLTDRAAGLSQPPGQDLDPAVVARANQLAVAGAEGGQRQAGHLSLPQLLRARRLSVRVRARRREAVPGRQSRRGRDPRHPGCHLAGRHRRRHREGGPGRPGGDARAGRTAPDPRRVDPSQPSPAGVRRGGWDGRAGLVPPDLPVVPGNAVLVQAVDDFSCGPTAATRAAPLLLVNHWVSKKGLADPLAASKANHNATLRARTERCLQERGLFPTMTRSTSPVVVTWSRRPGRSTPSWSDMAGDVKVTASTLEAEGDSTAAPASSAPPVDSARP